MATSGGFWVAARVWMILFNIEYECVSNYKTFYWKWWELVIGDLISQIGQIRVISIFRKSEVHRITGSIRNIIIKQSKLQEPQRTKARPRKY